ncbi:MULTISPECIES: hypothetical protein [unclassified Rhodanobacter]|uniref:hypothetical protein n=1 Tax=unclassified Rhodanobacter TaxID=2621553 RepID=UPI0007A9BB2E|nr:hypothetical protein [Rhodanobacter sp. FW510-R10]KZC30057.1 hypothetical protein RhoFW510R10_03535 [Rhodanobacter sp. FW510-R10]
MEGVPQNAVDHVTIEAAALRFVLEVALAHPSLRAEYDRLAGTARGTRRSPVDKAIDRATGRDDAELQGFLVFAKDALWDRAPDATRDAIRAQVRAAMAQYASGVSPSTAPD